MAEVDTRLEEALEAVLVRYGIPPAGLSAVGLWDRGDLSSDLADAARQAPSTVDAEGYERHLAEVYADLKAIYEAHPEHVVSFATTADGTCRACGQPVHAEASESRCGGPNPTDRCDALGAMLYGRIDAAFPPADVERWLAAWPASHAACWLIPPAYLDGTPNPRAGSGRIECCRAHANYYASAWVPRYPAEVGSAWIDVLAVAAAPDATAV